MNSPQIPMVATAVILFVSSNMFAQDAESGATGIQIERLPISIRDPEAFRVPLKLRPVQSLQLVAQMDGAVTETFSKAGDSVQAQAELIRFDSQERAIQLQIAQAEFELAKAELAAAASDAKSIAEAQLNVAQKKLDLASFRSQQTVIQAPITGLVSQIEVVEGQYVRAGDLLAVVYEPGKLIVEMPVERGKVEAGAKMSFLVEEKTVEGTVDAILEPLPEFDALRELFVSIATARVLIDANQAALHPGQAVSSPLIPRHPVAEIPIKAIHTDTGNAESERMVQVIREGFVRNLPIQMLGQVGQTHVFVSARFSPNDELILSASEDLLDGSWVRPALSEDALANTPRNRATGGNSGSSGGGSIIGPDGIRRSVYNKDVD